MNLVHDTLGHKVFNVSLRFYGELNDFLHLEKRRKSYYVTSKDSRSIKDLIESQGIPHTEVDLILINGRSVGFDHKIADGDRGSVYPFFRTFDISSISRLERSPIRSPRFVADVNLGKLNRNLRLLGIDCIYDITLADRELADISVRENRILLTRDRGLLMRKKIIHGIFIHSDCHLQQVREVVQRINFEKFIKPLTRCIKCNGILFPTDKKDVENKVAKETFRHIDRYCRCEKCGKIYWQGAHWNNLNSLIEEMTEECMQHSTK